MLEILRRGIWNFFRIEMEHIANCGDFKVVEEFKLPFENFKYSFDEKRIFAGDILNTQSPPSCTSSQSPPSSQQNPIPSDSLGPPSIRKPLLSEIREEDGCCGREDAYRKEEELLMEFGNERGLRIEKEQIERKIGHGWGKVRKEEEIERVKKEVKEFKKKVEENNLFYVIEQGKGEEKEEERKSN
jgi:hypothetical protein